MTRNTKLTMYGILLGLAGNVFGFVLYGLIFGWMNDVDFAWFYENVFWKTDLFKSQIITGSLLVNVLIFFVLFRMKKDELSKGMLITILLSVIAIIYYFA